MIEYRKATKDDNEQLSKLRVKQLIDEGYQNTHIEDEIKTYFAENLTNGSLTCWVGVVENVIVATAAVCFYQLPPSFSNPTGKVAYITNIYTENAFRKQGIASHLVNVLLDEIQTAGHRSVRLHASADGRAIYEKAGFVIADGMMVKKF